MGDIKPGVLEFNFDLVTFFETYAAPPFLQCIIVTFGQLLLRRRVSAARGQRQRDAPSPRRPQLVLRPRQVQA